ncbi:Lrp/AsnC family transcriptional regulator [Hyphomicrobium sp.]|uniref:Lrp/AsnC family transcriptional regulator n=1 Tax=Hyphomicrobium sp. TaxID=82 RepID=UPI0025C6204E|nr:Lrp/AsnC family transcriptional regulator [Hyphomicrobium sp.]
MLDAFDRRILLELQRSGRLTNVDLASRVGLSPSPCLARVKSLESAGIIRNYVALLDSERIGGTLSVFIHITLERQSQKVLEAFERTVVAMPEVMECYLMTGDADYLLRVVVRDAVALKDFILDKLTKTPGVANIHSRFALKQVKYNTALPLDQLWPQSQPAPKVRKPRRRTQR